MHGLTIIALGLASSLDNLGTGITYGIQGKRISIFSNAFISLISMAASYVSLSLGNWLGQFVPVSAANIAGGLLIALIGVWTLGVLIHPEPVVKIKKSMADPEYIDKDNNNIISLTEGLILGAALSLNAIGTAFSAGVSGLNPLMTTFSIGIFSFLFLEGGLFCGSRLKHSRAGKYSSLIAGLSLILIGLYEIFT